MTGKNEIMHKNISLVIKNSVFIEVEHINDVKMFQLCINFATYAMYLFFLCLQYLEMRYNKVIRLFGTVLFIIQTVSVFLFL